MRGGLLVLALVVAAGPSRARADDRAEDVATARALGVEGVRSAEAGRCDEAVDKLARADRLHHAPTLLVWLGECQVRLGKVVEGAETLERVAREVLPPGAPAAFVRAQVRAREVLAETRPRIARLVVRLVPAGVRAEVTLDGVPLSEAVLGQERATDPGPHALVARAAGFKEARASVTLEPGQLDAIEIALEPEPRLSAPEPAAAPVGVPTRPTAAPHRSTPPGRTAAWIALGVAGAGIAVGAVAGGIAAGGASDVAAACPAKACSPAAKGTLDGARTAGDASTVAFAIAAAGLVTAGVLVLVGATSASPPSAARLRPSPVGVTGEF